MFQAVTIVFLMTSGYDDSAVDYSRITPLLEVRGGRAVIYSPSVTVSDASAASAPARGLRFFWGLFIVNALLFGSLLVALLLMSHLPARSLDSLEAETLRAAVFTRLDGTVDDPLVEAAPGVFVRASNPGGLRLNGIVYYYYIEGERNFDPLSRGMVDHADIDIVLRDMSGPRPLVIYRLRH
jgi:hypothetical protein